MRRAQRAPERAVTAAIVVVFFLGVFASSSSAQSTIIGSGAYDALSPTGCAVDFQHLSFVQHVGACYRNANASSIRIDKITARYSAFQPDLGIRVRVVTGTKDGSGQVTPNFGSLVGSNAGAEQPSGKLEQVSTPGADFSVSFPASGAPVVINPGADFCVMFSKETAVDPTLFVHDCPPVVSDGSLIVVNDASHYAMSRTPSNSYMAPMWKSIQEGVRLRHSIEYSVYEYVDRTHARELPAFVYVAPTAATPTPRPAAASSAASGAARLPAVLAATVLPLLLLLVL